MYRSLTVFLLGLSLAVPALAGGKQEAANLAKKIAPLLDGQTVAVFHLKLASVDAGALAKVVGQMVPENQKEVVQDVEKKLKMILNVLDTAGAKDVYAVVSLADMPEPIFLAFPAANANAAQKMADALSRLGPVEEVMQKDAFVVIAKKKILNRVKSVEPVAHPELEKAFASAGKADAQFAIMVPELLKKAMIELNPRLPKELGDAEVAPLLQGFRWLGGGVNLPPKISIEAQLQATDAKAAEKTREVMIQVLGKLMSHAKKEIKEAKTLEVIQKGLELLAPKLNDDQLTWKVSQEEAFPIFLEAIAKMRIASTRMESQNNLKQIGIALHIYHDQYKTFPPLGNTDKKTKKPLLSWRVYILPYVEQGQLFQQFKLDEPWDSPHNKELISKMPAVYRSPNSKAPPGKTTYLGPVGKGLFFSGPKGLKITNFTDGTSNTIMLLEADDDNAVIWTKPEDLPVDPKQPLKGLGGNQKGTFNALFADGSVRTISAKIEPETFYKFLTTAGGEVVPVNP